MTRCIHCGLFRQNPRLSWDALKSYYPEDYSAYQPVISTEKSWFKQVDRRYGMRKRIRAIEQQLHGGRLLDIGCGTGVFLAELKRRSGWDIVGVEPVTEAARYASEYLNIEIFNRTFLNTNFPASSFDTITMWNVLEHFYAPIDNLQLAHHLLKPGGLLVFSIPNLESVEARLFGTHWLGWDLPRHLYLFPRDQLQTILHQIGFQIINRQCIAGGHAAFGLSMKFLSAKFPLDQLRFYQYMLALYHSLPSRLLLSPFFWLIAKLKQSSLVTFFAQKSD
jgi:2-polyprenyl-3-methyl-5-hydroxy-6-metoxy-1,4-benzoquinol methylase